MTRNWMYLYPDVEPKDFVHNNVRFDLSRVLTMSISIQVTYCIKDEIVDELNEI